jgi:hypothetical protein
VSIMFKNYSPQSLVHHPACNHFEIIPHRLPRHSLPFLTVYFSAVYASTSMRSLVACI